MQSPDPNPAPGQAWDGYQLIRFLGRGGFGEVWLCRSGATGTYHALKFISGRDADLIEKEHHSLGLYRSAAARLRSPHLVPIEHINRYTAGLYYVMPLADGIAPGDQPPFPRPAVRPNGSFRGRPQKANSLQFCPNPQ